MTMYSQSGRFWIWFVQHNIIRSNEFPRVADIDAESKNMSAVYSIGVWILNTKRGDRCACAVKILEIMGSLRGRVCNQRVCICRSCSLGRRGCG
jgi:hypothetical protein